MGAEHMSQCVYITHAKLLFFIIMSTKRKTLSAFQTSLSFITVCLLKLFVYYSNARVLVDSEKTRFCCCLYTRPISAYADWAAQPIIIILLVTNCVGWISGIAVYLSYYKQYITALHIYIIIIMRVVMCTSVPMHAQLVESTGVPLLASEEWTTGSCLLYDIIARIHIYQWEWTMPCMCCVFPPLFLIGFCNATLFVPHVMFCSTICCVVKLQLEILKLLQSLTHDHALY